MKRDTGGHAEAGIGDRKAAGLDPAEWYFDEVPAAELHACFLWEYARESAWILDLARRCQEQPLHTPEGDSWFEVFEQEVFNENPNPKTRIPKWRDDFETPEGKRWVEDLTTIAMARFSGRVDSSVCCLLSEWIHDGLISSPWQKLPKEQRAEIIRNAEETKKATSEPLTSVDELEEEKALWLLKRLKKRRVLDPLNSLQGLHTFLISWHAHTNKEILDAFKAWLEDMRPCFGREPLRQGHKLSDRRAWLKWLGAMRCLKRFSFAHPAFPQPFKRLGELEVYRMRKKARKLFKELFYFLPEPVEPVSFDTGRWRCARKAAAFPAE